MPARATGPALQEDRVIKPLIDLTYRQARKLVVGILGGTILLIGVLLIVLPGPAFIVIPVGLAILSLEFAWAKRYLLRVRQGISHYGRKRRMRAANRYADQK